MTNSDKRRFSLTLTRPDIEALNRLVESGLYMDHQDGMRQGLRRLFRFHGMEPLYNEVTKETEKVKEAEEN